MTELLDGNGLSLMLEPLSSGDDVCTDTECGDEIQNRELREVICRLNKELQSEKKISKQKDEFVANLSHDLKNPIQAIKRALQLLMNGTFGVLNKEQADIVSIMYESSVSTNRMLYTMIDSYKYDNGMFKLEKQITNADSLVKNCINEISGSVIEKSLSVSYNTEIPENERMLYVDPIHIRRVISNLLNNAVNYSFKNSELKISLSKIGDKFVFCFENSSPQISHEIREHIFDKYVTSGVKYSSAGLGLYLAKKIVEEHGGRIYLTCEGTNNKFTFELPADIPDGCSCTLNSTGE